MKKGLIGKKVGMTQIFDEKGMIIPVTVIEAGPCVVAQVKTVETDGYNAIQLGFGEVKSHKVNKPQAGHFAKANVEAKKHLRELLTNHLGIESKSLIIPILVDDNKRVLKIQNILKENGFLVGAIRQPTVKKAIIRLIAKIDINYDELKKACNLIKDLNANK